MRRNQCCVLALTILSRGGAEQLMAFKAAAASARGSPAPFDLQPCFQPQSPVLSPLCITWPITFPFLLWFPGESVSSVCDGQQIPCVSCGWWHRAVRGQSLNNSTWIPRRRCQHNSGFGLYYRGAAHRRGRWVEAAHPTCLVVPSLVTRAVNKGIKDSKELISSQTEWIYW